MARVLKSVGVGLAAVMLSILLLVVDALVTVRIRAGNPTGVGHLAVRVGLGTLLTGVAIFVVGFLWQYWRSAPDPES